MDCRLCLNLHSRLWQSYLERKSLTDPEVVAASRRLDRWVMHMMRGPVASCGMACQDYDGDALAEYAFPWGDLREREAKAGDRARVRA
jgi:hypothetical protein